MLSKCYSLVGVDENEIGFTDERESCYTQAAMIHISRDTGAIKRRTNRGDSQKPVFAGGEVQSNRICC